MMNTITFVTNNESIEYDLPPIITEVINVDFFFKKEFKTENQIILIDGFELAVDLFEKVDYLNHQVILDEPVYWFYTKEDSDSIILYQENLKKFIIEVLLYHFKKIKKSLVYKKEQLSFYEDKEVTLYKHPDLNIQYLYYKDRVEIIDLNYFSFFEKRINCISELLEFKLNIISFESIKLNLKKEGLIDKRFNSDNFLSFFRYYKYNSDDYNEGFLYFLIVYSNLINYKSINLKEEIKISSTLLNDNIEFNDTYKNLIDLENYFSNIEIKGINFNLYPQFEFPINKNVVQFEYNGSDTKTGRIFPTNLNNHQSLQTLPKEYKDLLSAEKNCYLIEFDYKSFEFDILCQLTNLPIIEDPHTEVIKYLLSEDFITSDMNYRALGKKINYAFIYGMNIDKMSDVIIEDFFNEEDRSTLDLNVLLELKELLKIKLENYPVYKSILQLTEQLLSKLNKRDKLLTTHFGRFIKIDSHHKLLNYFIQATAADFFNIKLRMIIDLLKKSNINLSKNKILIQNFDSLLLQLEIKHINNSDLFEKIIKIMEADLNGLVGRIKFTYGVNWKFLE